CIWRCRHRHADCLRAVRDCDRLVSRASALRTPHDRVVGGRPQTRQASRRQLRPESPALQLPIARPVREDRNTMGQPLDDAALDTLFREARTYSKWKPKPVTDQTVKDLYELLKWAPTSANAAPARFAFIR